MSVRDHVDLVNAKFSSYDFCPKLTLFYARRGFEDYWDSEVKHPDDYRTAWEPATDNLKAVLLKLTGIRLFFLGSL
jgi:hypothetical protein